MKRLLVTGQQGFVGTTLSRMVGVERRVAGWSVIDMPDNVDLRDAAATSAMIASAAPDAVLHLAAQSWVPDALRDPAATLQINLFGTLNVLQALKKCAFRGRMIYVGTGDVYGIVPEDALPVAETRLPAPRNPYSVSKLAAEALCYQWTATEGMDIVLARPFNHIGWGQSDRFVLSDFARQIVEIRQGRRKPAVAVGDIDVTRDFTDVRDVVYAYFALFASGASGEVYNVCSGRDRSIRSLLARLAELAGVAIAIEQDQARLRKAEQRRVCGDPAKITYATGWVADTPLDESLAAMLSYWESGDECQNRH
ncbi:MAG TPA: GDP-mannose 4,6-dehydratase [Casimicrobiaceae bacterium]|nr:GDP-mannose 4,6-dehydratase [Casimicrobiaceae bacterium]